MVDLKEVHDQLLDIMVEFDRICRKNNLKYTLAWGTLLGAVRHGGFIPWDSDIDVLMAREDYDRFCALAPDELKSDYFLQTKETEPAYRYNVCRLRKNNTALILKAWKNAGFHQGIYIDIQPLDHIPDKKFSRMVQKFFIILNTPVRMSVNPVLFREAGERFKGPVKAMLRVFCFLMPKKLCDRIEHHFIVKHNKKPCQKIGVICEGGVLLHTTRDMIPFDSRHMDEIGDIEFEGHRFMAVKDTDPLLTLWYGDYMQLPPEDKRVPDHDPLVFDPHNSYEIYLEETDS